ncbi:MAG: FAD-dependent oxidoreductase, partial [Rhodospirillales bacterium]|nr:FAD-dependent oxidoreductase [Rhodospirillales bacterium]
TILTDFLSRRNNDRTDEYGGSLENRVRLFREILQDTLEAVGDTCAVPVRFAVDELMGDNGLLCTEEGHDVIEMLAELPDLWDVNIASWENDSQTSRFAEEGFQEPFIDFVKKVTTKPVVGVGRYTSPDRMVSLVKNGVLDMIGAARPSIADPFLPKKIEEGRIEDIRECIGCNICVTGDHLMIPMRCTQNATMGEEWRRGWHPEKFAAKTSDDSVLVVGAGPAGLEASRVLGERGYSVVLAEKSDALGGRVAAERTLPGLSAWGRVSDYRTGQIQPMVNVETYLSSELDADAVMEFGAAHVAIATGSQWRYDGVGKTNHFPVPGAVKDANVYTPEDVMASAEIKGPVLVFDDDGYYMGGVLAEKLCKDGLDVTLMTPDVDVSNFTNNSLEQHTIQSGLMKMGVKVMAKHVLNAIEGTSVRATCVYTEAEKILEFVSVVMVTGQLPRNDLYYALIDRESEWADAGIKSVTRIGDAEGPAIIAAAVWSGHRYARELGEPKTEGVPFKREITEIVPD